MLYSGLGTSLMAKALLRSEVTTGKRREGDGGYRGERGREGEERVGWVENSVIQSWGEIT